MSWMTPPACGSGRDMVAPPVGVVAEDFVDVVTLLLHADQSQSEVGGQVANQVEALLAVDPQLQQMAGRANLSAGRGQGMTEPVPGATLGRLVHFDDQPSGGPGELRGRRGAQQPAG